MLSKSNGAAAEACYRESVQTADEQGARLVKLRSTVSLSPITDRWSLRSTVSLARFLQDAGDTKSARTVLQPAFASVTEGRNTPASREAATLLETLGGEVD